MKFQALNLEISDAVARVTLNRPDKLNALNHQLIADLRAAAAQIRDNAAVRAVLLMGSGRGFCAGADLTPGGLPTDAGKSAGENVGAQLREHFNPMIKAWYELPVPVVVAVNGIAAGAGVSLALIGDIVLAARSATFVQLFAPRLGLMPDLGSTFHLPRMLGTARAKGLALLGEPLTAGDAAAWGMIWGCVEDAELRDKAFNIARRLAAGPTRSFRRIKLMFNEELPTTLAEQLEREAIAQSQLGETDDFAEGVNAFLEKRAPAFTGR